MLSLAAPDSFAKRFNDAVLFIIVDLLGTQVKDRIKMGVTDLMTGRISRLD